MLQYTYFALALGVLTVLLMSTSASTTPMIICQQSPASGVPQSGSAGRTQCYMLDKVESPQDEGDFVDGPSSPFDRRIERGAKRQDVDHVFLRFGRRLGL